MREKEWNDSERGRETGRKLCERNKVAKYTGFLGFVHMWSNFVSLKPCFVPLSLHYVLIKQNNHIIHFIIHWSLCEKKEASVRLVWVKSNKEPENEVRERVVRMRSGFC